MASPSPSSLAELLPPEARARLTEALELLERRVEALPERAMRRAVLEQVFHAMSESEIVGSLALLVSRVAEGRGSARVVLVELALDESVLSALPYERQAAAYALARAVGAEGVARMFLSARPRDNIRADEAEKENEHLSLPLGIRRAAARTRDRLLLDRLVHDKNPRVIALLLDNPRLVERDVVRIAAMRPTQPEVLSVLARHGRWASNYRVRKALACNPYTPRPVALRLLPSLLVQDLRLVLQSVDLDPVVEAEIRRLLDRSRPRAAPAPSGPALTEAELDQFIAALAVPDPLARDAPPVRAEDLEAAREHGEVAVTNPFQEPEADSLSAEIEALIALAEGGLALVPVRDDDPFEQG